MDARVAAILEEVRGPSVLDVGCVGGFQDPDFIDHADWLHGPLVARFPDTIGIDLDPELISYLRAKGYPNVMVGHAESFELGRRFDTIVAGELIEHLPNPGLFLDRCQQHLERTGRLVVTTPYPFGYAAIAYACRSIRAQARTLTTLSGFARGQCVGWRRITDLPSSR